MRQVSVIGQLYMDGSIEVKMDVRQQWARAFEPCIACLPVYVTLGE